MGFGTKNQCAGEGPQQFSSLFLSQYSHSSFRTPSGIITKFFRSKTIYAFGNEASSSFREELVSPRKHHICSGLTRSKTPVPKLPLLIWELCAAETLPSNDASLNLLFRLSGVTSKYYFCKSYHIVSRQLRIKGYSFWRVMWVLVSRCSKCCIWLSLKTDEILFALSQDQFRNMYISPAISFPKSDSELHILFLCITFLFISTDWQNHSHLNLSSRKEEAFLFSENEEFISIQNVSFYKSQQLYGYTTWHSIVMLMIRTPLMKTFHLHWHGEARETRI